MCTTISISNNFAYMCKSMDFIDKYNYTFVYFPKNYEYEEDVFGNKLTSKYSMMGTTFKGFDQFIDGINEKGLMGSTNSFKNHVSFADFPENNAFNLTSTKLLNVFLANCQSVDEVVEFSKNIVILSKSFVNIDNFSRHYHYMITDKTGKTVVLEFVNGKIIPYINEIPVMTNGPKYPKHCQNLKKYLNDNKNKGNKKNINEISPTRRFIKAYKILENLKDKNLDNIPYDFFNILNEVAIKKEDFKNLELFHSPTITLYQTILDSNNKKYYFKYFNSNEIVEFDFIKLNGSNEKITFDLEY